MWTEHPATPPGWAMGELEHTRLQNLLTEELSRVMPREWRQLRLPDCGCECWHWTLWALRRVPLTSCLQCWPGNATWLSPTPLAAAGARSPGRWCRWLPGAPCWRSPHVSKHLQLQQVRERQEQSREPVAGQGRRVGRNKNKLRLIT